MAPDVVNVVAQDSRSTDAWGVSRAGRSRGRQHDDDHPESSTVVVDFKPTPFGHLVGALEVPGYPVRRVQAADAHQIFHSALDELRIIADQTGRALATIYQLDGSSEDWTQLAMENNFDHCAMHTGHDTAFLR